MAERPASARAVLIGNGRFGDPRLPAMPSDACVSEMRDLLVSDLCGWPTDQVMELRDVASPSDLARALVPAVREVQDVLLVYYVGHGVRTSEGQLALALADTDAGIEALPHTAMLYANLARILRGCPAATKLVILDCCHAELGNKAHFQSADLAETYPVDGLYFIGASRTNEKARFDPLGGLTYFTDAFVATVRDGLPQAADRIRLDQVFLALRARLVADGLPEPVDAGIRGAHQFPFARNAIHAAPAPAAAPDAARDARLDLLRQAEAIATAMSDRGSGHDAGTRCVALLHVAAELARDDPRDAARLTRKALAAAAVANLEQNYVGLVAEALAGVDLVRAERMADAMTEPAQRDRALHRVSRAGSTRRGPSASPGASAARIYGRKPSTTW